jgi:hypothetical protein
MIFREPIPFAEALQSLRARTILPTNLSSAELTQLAADVRQKSLFSARTTNAGYLEEVRGKIDALLSGETNEATARAQLQDVLDRLSYAPETGFPGEDAVPPAQQGELRDLSSDKRIRLVLETNLRQAANFGFQRQGQDDLARWQFPAYELIRLEPREEERDWQERFVRAGGELYDGRMIALKDADVWSQLGNSGLFDDGLDTTYPPYAFNSGMGWREVSREDAIALGVISAGEMPDFQATRLFEDLQEDAAQFTEDALRQALGELS